MISGRTPGFCDICEIRLFDAELCSVLWVDWTCETRGGSHNGRDYCGIVCSSPECRPKLTEKFQQIDEASIRRVLYTGRGKLSIRETFEVTAYNEDWRRPESIWRRIELLEVERGKSLKKKSSNWRWVRGG